MRPLNNEECCFVCRRRACGLGFGNKYRTGWLCQSCHDDKLGPKVFKMSGSKFDEVEEAALAAAGDAAGMYLDSLGRTDLATLSPEEWTHFCFILVEGFGTALRAAVGADVVLSDHRYAQVQSGEAA